MHGNQKLAKTCKLPYIDNSGDHITSVIPENDNNVVRAEVGKETKNLQKLATKQFRCDTCDYTTSRKSSFNAHLATWKHGKETLEMQNLQNLQNLQNPVKPNIAHHKCCNCGKQYVNKSGLWKHQQKCPTPGTNSTVSTEVVKADKDLIMLLINDNKELRNMLIEQAKEQAKEQFEYKNMMMEVIKTGTNYNNNNTHSNNKTFNLQFFLNETCKNAMNMSDFIDSIQLQLSDLERIGELGYVEGISSIITNNLKALDITQRPLHCTDKKRETMYIKDENKWVKEDDNKTHVRNAVRKVSNNNIRLLPQFKAKYPEHNNAYSKQSDMYDKLIIEVMSTQVEKEDKIIHNITKNVVIDKI